MVGGNVDRIHGRDLYSAARPSRRNCLIIIVTPAIYPHFLEFLYVDIQSTRHTLSRLWSRQPNNVMSEIECAQLHSELFRRRHSTRQSHGLSALAKRNCVFSCALYPVLFANDFDLDPITWIYKHDLDML